MNGNNNEEGQVKEILPPLKGKIDETDLRMREIFLFIIVKKPFHNLFFIKIYFSNFIIHFFIFI